MKLICSDESERHAIHVQWIYIYIYNEDIKKLGNIKDLGQLKQMFKEK